MRLFIALNLSNEQIDEVKRVQNRFIDEDLKASFPHEFHLTLRFLGDIEENDAEKVIFSLSKVRFNRFSLKLFDVGAFPNKKHIDVLWIGLEKNHNLEDLYNHISEALKKFEVKEDHEFHPHITLARVKHINNKDDFLEKMGKTVVNKLESEISSFTLYQSTLTPDGPIYEVLKEFETNS